MTTVRKEYPLDLSRVQFVSIRQIVKNHGVTLIDGMPTLVLDVVEDSEPLPRELLAYPPGRPLHEDPGQYLGTAELGSMVRHIYLAD
ncbi:MAG: hypothetical protein QM811_16785 [Pirellulales bacterium]